MHYMCKQLMLHVHYNIHFVLFSHTSLIDKLNKLKAKTYYYGHNY